MKSSEKNLRANQIGANCGNNTGKCNECICGTSCSSANCECGCKCCG